MHVINLGYLENGLFCFIELSNGNTNKSNKMLIGLNIATIISKTNNQDLIDLIVLKTKQANKKKEKIGRY